MTATCATVTGLAARTEHVGHKLYMDSFSSSPALFDDLHTVTINCCGTVRPNRKGMLKNFGHKMKLKRDDLKTKVKSNLTAIVWKDKQNVNILMNIHPPPLEANFCDKQGKTTKQAIIQDYNRHAGYTDNSDRIMKSYFISRRTWKWTKKLFIHLLDLTILNSFIILASCGSELSHSQFRMTSVRDIIQEVGRVP